MKAVKIVLVGSSHAGKTSIVNRYVYSKFTPHTVPTNQPAFAEKKLSFRDVDLSLEIWDTAGQERYHALCPLFYRDAEAGIVVFDVTDGDSFEKAKTWVQELKMARGDNIHVVVAGNKADLKDKRCVSLPEAQQLAKSINANYFETSAKSGENVENLFSSICQYVVNKLSSLELISIEPRISKSLKNNIQFEDDNSRQKSCC